MDIYLFQGGSERGPYSRKDIFLLLKEGGTTMDTLARFEADSEYRSLSVILNSDARAFFSVVELNQRQQEMPKLSAIVPELSQGSRSAALGTYPPLKRRFLVHLFVLAAIATTVLAVILIRQKTFPETSAISKVQLQTSVPAVMGASGLTKFQSPPIPKPATADPIAFQKVAPTPTPETLVGNLNPTPPESILQNQPPIKLSTNLFSSKNDEPIIKKIAFPVSPEIQKAELWSVHFTDSPRGIVVICLDNGQSMTQGLKDKGWYEFSKQNNFLLAVVSFASDKRLFGQGKGFIHAERESGRLLLQGLDQLGVGDLPIYIYGLGAGGTFVSSFSSLHSNLVKSWCVYTNQLLTHPTKKDSRPALLAADYEDTKVNSMRSVFEEARSRSLKWTWVSIATPLIGRKEQMGHFVRAYLSAVINYQSGEEEWTTIDPPEKAFYADTVNSPKQVVWLPDKSLFEAWKKMMPVSSQKVDPIIIRKVIKTRIPEQPELEMFLRLPPNYSKTRPVAGTLAFCTWTEGSDDIAKQLLYRTDMKVLSAPGPVGIAARLIRYAEQHNLAVLTWNTRDIWKNGTSNEDLEKQRQQYFNRSFNKLADAWEEGVKYYEKNYSVPATNMLVYGISRGGNWVLRLVLRKPQRFLAAHIHVPGTFDIPTPAARHMLWLLTTGERDGGYERAVHFYRQCRNLDYPMIFKAVIGAGHGDTTKAEQIGFRFFDYALAGKLALEAQAKKHAKGVTPPLYTFWTASYQRPPFVGDLLNQEMFPLSESNMIPTALRVPLPSDQLAEAWKEKP